MHYRHYWIRCGRGFHYHRYHSFIQYYLSPDVYNTCKYHCYETKVGYE